MSIRLTALLSLLALTACPGNQVSTELLESGSYTSVDDSTVTLTVDVDALTFTVAQEGGESASGTLTLADEDDWAECCYLNGSGHTQFETYRMDPASFTVGAVEVSDGALNASPTIQAFEPAAEADVGFRFE